MMYEWHLTLSKTRMLDVSRSLRFAAAPTKISRASRNRKTITEEMKNYMYVCFIFYFFSAENIGDIAKELNTSEGERKKDELDLTFLDHHAAFKNKTTWEVFRAYMVFNLCSIRYLVDNNEAVSIIFSDGSDLGTWSLEMSHLLVLKYPKIGHTIWLGVVPIWTHHLSILLH